MRNTEYRIQRGFERGGRPVVSSLCLLYSVFCILAAAFPLLSAPLEHPTPTTNPLQFGSIRPDPIESVLLEPGAWSATATLTYFNMWNVTLQPRNLHEALHLERQPMTSEEWRYLEQQYPDDEMYFVDLEGLRTDLTFSYGLTKGLTITAEIPWIDVGGGPKMDSFAEGFHSTLFGGNQFGRDLFPRGQNYLYLRAKRKTAEIPDAAVSGIGDTTLSLAVPLVRGAHEQSLVVSVQAPTGERGTLSGSGGWDGGVSWFGKWRGERRSWLAGGGISYLDPAGDLAGFERASTWHLMGEVDQSLRGKLSARLGLRIDSSPLADSFTREDVGAPSFYYRLGLAYDLRGGQSLFFDLGEELAPAIGAEADWTFHFGWISRP